MDMIAANSLDVYEEELLDGFMEMWSEEEDVEESLMPVLYRTLKVNDDAVVDNFASSKIILFTVIYIRFMILSFCFNRFHQKQTQIS